MFPSITKIFNLIGLYKYFLIFPLGILEGPIITIIAGFLSSLGQLNFFYSYLILVTGDLIGDSGLYFLGKFGGSKFTYKWLKYIGVTREKVLFVEKKFLEHPKKIFSLGKVSHGPGAAILFAAGLTKFPFGKFFFYNTVLTLIKSFILILIGFYFGQAYIHIKQYMDYAAIGFGCSFILIYILFLKYSSAYLNENTNRDR